MTDDVLFWTQVSAIGQVAGALATAAAVIVSLWIVLSERLPQIKVRAGIRLVVGGGAPALDVMSFTLTNVGTRSFQIAQVGWRTGWLPFGPKWLKHQHAIQVLGPPVTIPGSSVPPFDIAAGERKGIHVSCDLYEAHRRDGDLFGRKIPLFKERKAPNVHFWIEIVGARTKYVKVERSLEQFLLTGKIDKGADDFNEKAAKANAD